MSQQRIHAAGGQGLRQSPHEADREAAAVRPSPTQPASVPVHPFLLTAEQSAAWMGVSLRTFHALRSESWMPKPVVLGPRLHRWRRAELEHAVSLMPRDEAPRGGEPAQLLRGKIERLKRTGVPA